MITDITVLYGTVCLYQKRMAHYEHALYFDNNSLYSVDNTRYNNILECVYHYRSIS